MSIHSIHIMIFLFLLSSFEAGAYTDSDCIKCHDRAGKGSALKMSADQFNSSIHGGETSCQECHTYVLDDAHQESVGSGAVGCNGCHDQKNRHGIRALDNRPKCFNCHTRHNIRSKDDPHATVHPDRLQQTCRACHPAESGAVGYLSWFISIQIASHPKQDFSQVYSRKNCMGCHQGTAAHGEPDPINELNCHVCHLTGEGKNKLWGVMHPDAQMETQPGVFAASVTYQLILVILVLGGFRRLVRYFSKPAKGKD